MLKYEHRLPTIKDPSKFAEYIEFINTYDISKYGDDIFTIENHHIVPQCYLMNEEYKDKENIIALRAKDHYIAHQLLWQSLHDSCMTDAFWFMSHVKRQDELFRVDKDLYDQLKYERSIILGKRMREIMTGRPSLRKGKHLTEEHKANISKAAMGRKPSEETLKKLSESHKGYIMPESQKQKLRASLTGIVKDDVWRANLSASNMGKPHGVKNGIQIYRGSERTTVPAEQLQDYLNAGWKKGRNLMWIHKDGTIKMIGKEEFSDYSKDGWKKGTNRNNRKGGIEIEH